MVFFIRWHIEHPPKPSSLHFQNYFLGPQNLWKRQMVALSEVDPKINPSQLQSKLPKAIPFRGTQGL